MRPHERLEVWQTAVDFVVNIYKQTESFPKDGTVWFDIASTTRCGVDCREYRGRRRKRFAKGVLLFPFKRSGFCERISNRITNRPPAVISY